jgi:hypothetical protein
MISINWKRLGISILACIVGVATGTAATTYPFTYFMQMGYGNLCEHLVFAWHSALSIGPWFFSITLFFMIAVGLPVQNYMQRKGIVKWLNHAMSATIAGFILPCMTGAGIFYAPFGLVSGFVAGSVFWLIRRPDKDSLPVKAEEVVT